MNSYAAGRCFRSTIKRYNSSDSNLPKYCLFGNLPLETAKNLNQFVEELGNVAIHRYQPNKMHCGHFPKNYLPQQDTK